MDIYCDLNKVSVKTNRPGKLLFIDLLYKLLGGHH